MIKKLLVALAALILIAAGTAGLLVINADSLVAHLKPEIERSATQALGHRVSLGQIKTELFPNLRLQLKQIDIAPASKKARAGVSLEGLFLDLRLLPLLRKRLEVRRLAMEHPEIALERDSQGVHLVGLTPVEPAPRQGPAQQPPALPRAGTARDSNLKLALNRFQINNGRIVFNDLTANRNYTATDLFFSSSLNLRGKEVTLEDVSLRARAVNTLETVRVDSARVEVAGSSPDKKSLTLSAPEINLSLEIPHVSARFGLFLAENALSLSNFSALLFSGQTTGECKLALKDKRPFSLNLQGNGIRIEEVLAALNRTGQPKAAGLLDSFSLSLAGQVVPALAQTITGQAKMALKDGVLKDINLAGTVLKAVNNLPLLTGGLLERGSADSENSGPNSNDTLIKSLTGSFSIGDAKVSTQDLKLLSDIFTLEANGTVGFDMNLDLNATLLFNRAFSDDLAKTKKDIKKIFDSEGRLVIPLTLKGVPPKILVTPNFEKLVEVGAQRALTGTAQEIVGGLLGGGKNKNSRKGLGGLLGF